MSEKFFLSVFILAGLSLEANPSPELRTCIQGDKEKWEVTWWRGRGVGNQSHIYQKTKVCKTPVRSAEHGEAEDFYIPASTREGQRLQGAVLSLGLQPSMGCKACSGTQIILCHQR